MKNPLVAFILASVAAMAAARDRFNQAHPAAGYRAGKHSSPGRPNPAGTKLAKKAAKHQIGVCHG